MTDNNTWITKKKKDNNTWITKKKKDNKKFYGYTGPVKPEKKSKWIGKKSDNKSYGYTEVVKQKKEPTTWITKKKK